jgi:hypothetical protein
MVNSYFCWTYVYTIKQWIILLPIILILLYVDGIMWHVYYARNDDDKTTRSALMRRARFYVLYTRIKNVKQNSIKIIVGYAYALV